MNEPIDSVTWFRLFGGAWLALVIIVAAAYYFFPGLFKNEDGD